MTKTAGDYLVQVLGTDYKQEVDLLSLFKDVAHHYVQMASSPSQIRHLVDRGHAATGREREMRRPAAIRAGNKKGGLRAA